MNQHLNLLKYSTYFFLLNSPFLMNLIKFPTSRLIFSKKNHPFNSTNLYSNLFTPRSGLYSYFLIKDPFCLHLKSLNSLSKSHAITLFIVIKTHLCL